ncbi:VENN motif pre-toxin domain-containing protein [Klebsiella sp. Ap-873]|nr:VENN motif pre-toxin domain-containing protein [Klebsiella sp. Ap-873]
MAHAVLGAVVAKIQGNNALSGAAGATTAEFLAQQMYPGIKREDLSEEQKQTISALSTLAAGLAGGLAGNSTADVVAGAQAGKNAVENNAFNLAGRTHKEIESSIQKQAEGVDLDDIYGNDQSKKDAFKKGREQGVKDGLKDGVSESLEGAVNTILHPMDTIADLASAIWNYDKTYDAIKISVAEWNQLYDYALVNNPELAGQMVGSLQGKVLGDIGGNTIVSGATVKIIQKVARMESGIKMLPDANGKLHATMVSGDAHIPVDKIEVWLRGGASGDLNASKARLEVLRKEQMADQRAFEKSGKKAEVDALKNDIRRIEKSRTMGENLLRAGIDNESNLNNSIIIEKLFDSAKELTLENRMSSVVLKGPTGSVRLNAAWTIQPDGTKRLSTVTSQLFDVKGSGK